MTSRYRSVALRKSHPMLYQLIMAIATGEVALALNYWFGRAPAFTPYGFNNDLVGLAFFLLGSTLAVFLNVYRNLRLVRLTLAASISWMLFWGGSNTQQFFQGKTSLALPILLGTLSAVQVPLIVESPVNPMTKKKP